jgi:hypothetical protein
MHVRRDHGRLAVAFGATAPMLAGAAVSLAGPATHDVTEAATCSPAGALDFTAQVRVPRCASTAADPHPPWRTP